MHWTVTLLLCICTACLVLNAAQWRMVGTVRVSGMLVCAFWGAQELYWWLTKADSLLLFLACDLALVTWFWRRGAADWSDQVIAALIPPTTACVIFAHFHGGATTESYWINISMVAAQMLLGLPRGAGQRALGSFSHGSSKRQGVQAIPLLVATWIAGERTTFDPSVYLIWATWTIWLAAKTMVIEVSGKLQLAVCLYALWTLVWVAWRLQIGG